MLNFCLFCHSNFVCTRFHGTEPFARTLSGSAVALAPQSPSLGHLSCICSVCTFGAPLEVPRTKALQSWRETRLLLSAPFGLPLSGLGLQPKNIVRLVPSQPSWGTKAQGLFCHSNFVCTRFHGTEPLYHTFGWLHILRMKDIELFKEVIL